MARREAVENLRYDAPREAIRRIDQPMGGFKTRGRCRRICACLVAIRFRSTFSAGLRDAELSATVGAETFERFR